METIQECVGWAGACLLACYYISPVIPFINVFKGKLNFENTPGIFVTICYINCFIWYIYGELIFSDQIKISNMVGAAISLLLIIIYLIFEIKKYLFDAILNCLLLVTGTLALYKFLAIIVNDDKTVGKICMATTAIIYLFPILILYRVIKEKNYILIPVYSVWVYLFSCISWVIYGVLITDFYLVFPYSSGIILSLIQIMIYLIYKRKYPVISEKDFGTSIGIETSGNEEIAKEESRIKFDDISQLKGKEKAVKIISKTEG